MLVPDSEEKPGGVCLEKQTGARELHACNPSFSWRLRQEAGKFEASLGNLVRHCFKNETGLRCSSVAENCLVCSRL